jgi:hypothetical protein
MSLGSGGGGTTTQTTQQSSAPWGAQQPFLTYGFNEAQRIYEGDTPSYFPGSTVTGFAPQQQLALDLAENRALQGNPLTAMGQDVYGQTLAGDFLSAGNPYFGAMAERIQNQVQPAVDSRFAGSGRFGSAGHTEATSRAMADALAPLAFQNYQQERGLQNQAALGAPQYAQQDYLDIGRLAGVGDQYRALEAQHLGDAIARHDFNANLPGNKLAQYMGQIGGNYGGTTTGTSTTQSPSFSNPLATGLGILGMGASFIPGIGPFAGPAIGAFGAGQGIADGWGGF